MKVTIGAVTKGRTSLNYKTGNWRDERPVIDQENCKHCGMCYDACPDSSIKGFPMEGEKKKLMYLIDYDYCKGCGLCAYECPADCIEMVPEGK